MRSAIAVALLALTVIPLSAQERARWAPWTVLTGADTGAVGGCRTEDDDETVNCLLVRCHASRGLELVYRHRGFDMADPVRRYRVTVGRWSTEVELERTGPGEKALSLAGRDELIRRIGARGGEDLIALNALHTTNSYSTTFPRRGAGPAIERVRRACRR